MTRKSIESSSCSKEGCLQSIERLNAQPASLQWDLHVTSRDHFEAAKSCTTQTFFLLNVFMNTTVMYLYLFMCKHSFQFKEYFLSCFDRSSF